MTHNQPAADQGASGAQVTADANVLNNLRRAIHRGNHHRTRGLNPEQARAAQAREAREADQQLTPTHGLSHVG